VKFEAEVCYSASCTGHDDRRVVVGDLSLRLGVDADQVQVLPDLLHELIEVPLVLGGDGHVVRHLVQEVELLNGDGVDLVEDVEAGDVHSVLFNDINQLVHGGVLTEVDVAVGHLVLVEDAPDGVISHFGHVQAHLLSDVNATFILLLQLNEGQLLVESNSETFQLTLDNSLVGERLEAIEDNKDEGAGTSHTDNLLTATLTVLSAFNDTGKIEKLDLGSLVLEHTGNAGEGRELVSSRF